MKHTNTFLPNSKWSHIIIIANNSTKESFECVLC